MVLLFGIFEYTALYFAYYAHSASCKSYRNYQQDPTVKDNLLFHCSLTAQHVSSDIIVHHLELVNCNYSFWFDSRLLLPATADSDKRE
jgi:hypothetical protein